MEDEGDDSLCRDTKGLVQGLGNKMTDGDHPNYSLVEIGTNIMKSLGNLRIAAVTQTPGEN